MNTKHIHPETCPVCGQAPKNSFRKKLGLWRIGCCQEFDAWIEKHSDHPIVGRKELRIAVLDWQRAVNKFDTIYSQGD